MIDPLMLVDTLGWIGLAALLCAIAWTDLRSHRIPNRLNAALLLSGLAMAVLLGEPSVPDAVLGALLGGLFLLALAIGFQRLRGRDGLGLGDVKFLAGAGAWTGWEGVGPTVFLAAIAALLVTGARRLGGATVRPHDRIAFGPFLCSAMLAVRIARQRGLWP